VILLAVGEWDSLEYGDPVLRRLVKKARSPLAFLGRMAVLEVATSSSSGGILVVEIHHANGI
jgi:hypothetical protein